MSEQHKEEIQTEHNIENQTENIEMENTPETEEIGVTETLIEEVEKSETSSQQLEKELAEAKDKYLRMYAEFENFRRRVAKEKADLIKNASEDLLKSLLPIIDDFERAQKSMRKAEETTFSQPEDMKREVSAIQEGILLVYNKMMKVLEQRGLRPMESSIGKSFNIDEQESITQIPAPNEEMKGKVVDEVEKGYYLNEKVIRFAKVVVGS